MTKNLLRFSYGENNINTGPLREIPEICIDHFVGTDLNSSVFFLSHAHTDHLVGLETEEFLRRLDQPGVQLYCHHLTPILLGFFERYLGGPAGIEKLIKKRKIIPLDVEKPFLLKIPRRTGGGHVDVKVTLLSAGHCPGSVMFLFETSSLCLLHTGDFRLTLEDLKRMPYLHVNKKPKPIDHLYVDTTFCSTSANMFPNRKEIIKEAMDKIKGWVMLSKQHIVYISFSARFAHEYVLLELFRTFQQKIHVTEERLQIYRHIPDLYKIVTLDNDTQFHLCNRKDCDANDNSNAITLRLSSMWFTRGKDDNRKPITWNGSFLTLCYSMHSSLQEIGTTIDYLKPKIVTPLVLPKKSNLKEVREALMSVTTHKFNFVDYYSSRVDFEENCTSASDSSQLCKEERDDTDLKDEDDVPENDSVSDSETDYETGSDQDKDKNSQGSSTGSILDSPSPKKPKVVWQYTVYTSSSESESPSSQGSTDLSNSPCKALNDMEQMNKDKDDDKFLKPVAPAPSTSVSSNSYRRNLTSALTDASAQNKNEPSNSNGNSITIANAQKSFPDSGSVRARTSQIIWTKCESDSDDDEATSGDIDDDDDIDMNSQRLF